MANLNQITLIGFMGQDPVVGTTQNGSKFAKISVGTTEKGYTSKNGTEVPDKTEWHNVTLWRHSAEFAEKYCRKGSQVFVQGKLRHRTYQDKDGNSKYASEIEAETFELLDRANSTGANGQSNAQTGNVAPTQQEQSNGLPF